jgi:hypothetical protein
MDASDEREVRAARNQSLFRAVNEKLRQLNESFEGLTDTFAIACECSHLHCVELIEIPADAYDEVRRSPRTFVVLPEHADTLIERITDEGREYAIVEVFAPAAARVVEEAEARPGG